MINPTELSRDLFYSWFCSGGANRDSAENAYSNAMLICGVNPRIYEDEFAFRFAVKAACIRCVADGNKLSALDEFLQKRRVMQDA